MLYNFTILDMRSLAADGSRRPRGVAEKNKEAGKGLHIKIKIFQGEMHVLSAMRIRQRCCR